MPDNRQTVLQPGEPVCDTTEAFLDTRRHWRRDRARVVKAFTTQASYVVDDPVDAGPLRLSREIEALQRLYMVPLIQRRAAAWEPYFRRSYFWECIWIDEYSEPVGDADDLAEFPETQGPAKDCPGT